jgi:molybdate/tungstate transport system permease protein
MQGAIERLRRYLPVTLAGVLSASLLLLFFLPLVALFEDVPGGWSAIATEARDPAFTSSLGFTAFASLLAVVLALAGGVPLGYLLARRSFPGKSWIRSLATLPIVLPHLIAGLAIFLLFDPYAPFSEAISASLHTPWPPPGFPVFDTIWGVVLVMVYVSAPYLILSSEIAFRAVDERVVEAARSLGAPPSEVMATVTLPLALRGIISGALLAWARAVSEIGGLLIIAYTVYGNASTPYNGPATQPLSVLIYSYWPDQAAAAEAASCVLVLLAFVIFLSIRVLEGEKGILGLRGVVAP